MQYEIDNYESLHPGYDEYRFDLDEIGHDPYVLTSILSALHEGVFTLGDVQGDLAMLFEKQYTLTQTIETETRYRTETRTDSEGNSYTVEVPYTYYICNVKLENFDLSHLPVYIMGEDQMSLYAAYMHTLGQPARPVSKRHLSQRIHRQGADLLRHSPGGVGGCHLCRNDGGGGKVCGLSLCVGRRLSQHQL